MPARTARVLESVAANVRRLRDKRQMTQERLAEEADLHLTYVQAIERGTRNISVGVLVSLADALDVQPYVLLRPAKLLPVRLGRPKKAGRSFP